MKIGFDAKRAFLNRTGLGNYSRWLIASLAQFHPEHRYFLYTPKTKPGITFPAPQSQLVTRLPSFPFFKSLWRSRWIVKDLKRDQIEVYHGLSHELPRGIETSGIKSVVTVHDLIFMRFPQYFKPVDRMIYSSKLKHACQVADKIVAISQKTKDDLIELLHIAPERIKVIYQGCDGIFRSQQTAQQKQAVKRKYELPERFLLSVGTIEPRKNLLLLVKALIDVPEIKLVVIGKPTVYLDEIKVFIAENRLSDRVTFLHDVAFTDLPAIYQQAGCFIYPSRYEGFGIPVLEAITSGIPVIATTGSCLEEAGGPDSLYVDPDDAHELAEKINLVLTDETLQKNMTDKGLAYSRNFDPGVLADQYMRLYQNLVNHA